MGAASHVIVPVLCFVAALLSIPILYICLIKRDHINSCVALPHWPAILVSASIAAAALAGVAGGILRLRRLVVFYFVVMLLPITLLALLIAFLFVSTAHAGAARLPTAPTAYRLTDYPAWLRRRVEGAEKWEGLRACMSRARFCAELEQVYRIPQDFINARITPLQAGCCKPPSECGYSYGGPTYWTFPNNTAAGMDCVAWSNNQTQLCFACDSCKAGLLANVTAEWRSKLYFLFAVFCALASLYLFALCAFKVTRRDDSTSNAIK